jgi:hypothetical protein
MVVFASVWTSRTSADADETEILSLISDFMTAEAKQSQIPAEALPIVEERLAALADAEDERVADDESAVHDILPADVRQGIDKAFADRLATYCSAAYQERHADDVSLSGVVEAGLHNSPKAPVCVESKQILMAGVLKSNDDGIAIVWTYSWSGDETTQGHGAQAWAFEEYRLIREDGEWRIDARSSLASSTPVRDARQPAAWGPYSVHYPLAEAELEGTSELGLDDSAVRSGLTSLESLALTKAQE